FDVLALLLGDDRQRALRFAADLLAQRAVAEGAHPANQQGQGDERKSEAQAGMTAAALAGGSIGGGGMVHGLKVRARRQAGARWRKDVRIVAPPQERCNPLRAI